MILKRVELLCVFGGVRSRIRLGRRCLRSQKLHNVSYPGVRSRIRLGRRCLRRATPMQKPSLLV
ncbi:hypothetical protein [Nostoc sp.]|uniref:hypothetical protein n=1 Tax=Nostoc sp. TaxID=1180 RepID=UPI002FFA2E74